MRNYRIISLLLSIVLFLNIFAGCAKNTSMTTDNSQINIESESEKEEVPVRYLNGGELSFLAKEPITIPKFSEMKCERADVEPIITKIENLTKKAADCNDAEELLADYYAFCPELYHFYTMSSLSYIRLTQDYAGEETNDLFDYYSEPDARLAEKLDELYAALSKNTCRDSLEKAYFGEGFFDYYDNCNITSGVYSELLMKENELYQQYYDLTQDGINMYDLNEVKEKHDELAEVFVEMVKVRNQIAKEKGYANYMEYVYPLNYERDYSTQEARDFLNHVQTILVPLGQHDELRYADFAPIDVPYGPKAYEKISKLANTLGGPVLEAFSFMKEYDLCDISASNKKMHCAYVTYLFEYEAPVIIIKLEDGASYTTFSHEFGHFVDRYYNYGDNVNMDIEEIYSQVMEYLYLSHDDISQNMREQNIRALLADTLTYNIFRECAYADFELQVYELAPEEITIEKIDNIFYECMKAYGLISENASSSEGKRWVGYHHFFDRSGYVISYATSAIATLEICALDAENPGAAFDAFCRLLNRTHGKQYSYVLKEAGLENPFEASTLIKISDFIKHTFNID